MQKFSLMHIFPGAVTTALCWGGHPREAGVWEAEQKREGERDGASSGPLASFLYPQPEGPQ